MARLDTTTSDAASFRLCDRDLPFALFLFLFLFLRSVVAGMVFMFFVFCFNEPRGAPLYSNPQNPHYMLLSKTPQPSSRLFLRASRLRLR